MLRDAAESFHVACDTYMRDTALIWVERDRDRLTRLAE
jgi:hypothetical protein